MSQKHKREKVKADPAHVKAARELRDRYLEQFNSGNVLPNAKYEVSRALVSVVEPQIGSAEMPTKLLAA